MAGTQSMAATARGAQPSGGLGGERPGAKANNNAVHADRVTLRRIGRLVEKLANLGGQGVGAADP